jgi:acyl-CoA thioester hydrolase
MTAMTWPDVAGRIVNGVHYLPLRIYYADTDISGAVYHANYLSYCERARSDCLRLLGVQQSETNWSTSGGQMGFVVRRALCDFHRPARMDDLLTIETRFKAMSGARVEIAQRIMRGAELLFEAEVLVAVVDGRGVPKRIPDSLKQAMAAFLPRPL